MSMKISVKTRFESDESKSLGAAVRVPKISVKTRFESGESKSLGAVRVNTC